MGLYWGVGGGVGCRRMHGSVWDCMGIAWGCVGCSRLYGSVRGVGGCVGCRGLYGTVWVCVGLYGTVGV